MLSAIVARTESLAAYAMVAVVPQQVGDLLNGEVAARG
jgi:hypothetical protein